MKSLLLFSMTLASVPAMAPALAIASEGGEAVDGEILVIGQSEGYITLNSVTDRKSVV